MFPEYLPRVPEELLPGVRGRDGHEGEFQQQAFPVYNQRTDLELSTKGSALDFSTVTFIYSGRWVGADWFTHLNDFVKDANKTPADWDAEDFVSAARNA